MYQRGSGVKRDSARAPMLFQQGCERGAMDGCAHLGVLYRQGAGVTRDVSRAAALFQQSCDGGDMLGCSNLGALYAAGEGVKQDFTRATDLFKRSCDAKVALGCLGLGRLHAAGTGVPRNDSTAADLFKRACDGDEVGGCFSLATAYESGLGVTQNFQRAAELLRQACIGATSARRATDSPDCTRREQAFVATPSEPRRQMRRACDYGYAAACVKPKAIMTTSGKPLLAAEHLSKEYKNVVALDDVSFTISDGITGILGENGAGKSTAIKIFLGLDSADVRLGDGARRERIREHQRAHATRLHAGARLPAEPGECRRVPDAHGGGEWTSAVDGAHARRRHAATHGSVRGTLSRDRRLLDGHEAASEAGAGAGARSGVRLSRRADGRTRPDGS